MRKNLIIWNSSSNQAFSSNICWWARNVVAEYVTRDGWSAFVRMARCLVMRDEPE